MNEFKLIVTGSSDFNNAELLSRTIHAMAEVEYANVAIAIVSGMSKGADLLGYHFAKSLGIPVHTYPANIKLGKHAGYLRNMEMGNAADGLLVFSNGTKNTEHIISYMKRLNKPVTVISY